MFLSSLHFSVTTSSYSGFNLKPKQVKCLEALYFGKDVVAVLPTGYGKSMIFHLLSSLFYDKMKRTAPSPSLRPVVIVVYPLNALIKDQIRTTEEGNLKAAILSVKRKKITGDLQIDFNDGNLDLLKGAKYDIVFTHPEAFISCKEGMEIFQSQLYQSSVQVLVIDEAHCILEW